MSKTYYYSEGKSNRKKYKIAGGIFLSTGSLLILYFLYPLLSWQIYFSRAESVDFEVPIPKYSLADKTISSLIVNRFSQITSDYEDARSWYPQLQPRNIKTETYLLSIPKLGIKNSVVSTSSYDLSKHLVQYAGTALPGEKGSAVIFGHSSLPQLFSPINYRTIFATVHKLQIGDEILINIKGAEFSYKIEKVLIADADDISMFTQDYDSSYVTLVTCTPPGTVWKRLIIKSKLQPLSDRA